MKKHYTNLSPNAHNENFYAAFHYKIHDLWGDLFTESVNSRQKAATVCFLNLSLYNLV